MGFRWLLPLCLLLGGCSSKSPPPIRGLSPQGGLGGSAGSGGSSGGEGGNGSNSDGGIAIDTTVDPDAACAYSEIKVEREPAQLYFVLDRSGSMLEKQGNTTKYQAMRSAVVNLVSEIGWRSRVGAALYPGINGANACSAGYESIPLQPGDPKSYFDKGEVGPVAKIFTVHTAVSPAGGTPTAQTLINLKDKLLSAGPHTFVLLATDGGPNCHAGPTCDEERCIPNIEGFQGCSTPVNCCDPSQNSQYTTRNCLDSDRTLTAIADLANGGVKTLVIGMPGSSHYASLLDAMAVAGGAPRDSNPRYYRIDDLNSLQGLLSTLGKNVIISCDLKLDAKPTDANLVNVAFDGKLIWKDGENGWSWLSDTEIRIHGEACDRLSSGSVSVIQVLEGCPTQVD